MARIPSAPPLSPSASASGLTLFSIPVRQSPPDLPAPVTGTVISSNPQTQEIRLQTAAGQISLQSAIPLPPGTEISVQVYMEKGRLLANITLLKQNIALSKELEKIISTKPSDTPAPPPPLQEGEKVTALLLPAEAPVPIEQMAASLEAMKTSGLLKPSLPLPPEVLKTLLNTPDIKELLKTLPPQQLQQIASFIRTTERVLPAAEVPQAGLLRQLLSAYIPQIFSAKPVSAETAAPATPDNDLIEILRAQMNIKTTQQSAQPAEAVIKTVSAASPSSVPMVLEALLSLPAGLQPQKDAPFAALFQQILPQNFQNTAPVPQNMYQLNIIKIIPPDMPEKEIQAILQKIPLPQNTSIVPQMATIETLTTSGFPILKTADSHFVLKAPASVPVGSVVVFEATLMTPEQIVAHAPLIATAKPEFTPLSSGTWPALQEALEILRPLDTAAAQAFRNTLPTPNQRLAPTALFFLAALRLGTVDKWLGDNTLLVLRQSGKKGLIERLGGDFSKISAQAKEPVGDNWRAISIPLLHDDQLSQMQFYVRHQQERDGDGKEGKGKTTRFILNLDLSRIGKMQLDGFIQKKKFDMVLRTEEKLPFDMRQELMQRFARGLEQVNMQGGISFQGKAQSWVIIDATA